MKIVYFEEKYHKYFSNTEDYISVGGLWKQYCKEFDGDNVAYKKAYKELDTEVYNQCKKEVDYHSNEFLPHLKQVSKIDFMIIEELANQYLKTWNDKRASGKLFHLSQENLDYDRGYRINPFDGKKYKTISWDKLHDNQSCHTKLIDLPDGYIVEHLVKNDDYLVAGQLDQNYIETIKGVRYIDINDWKTDGEIELKPKFYDKKNGLKKLFYPFNHIYDTNFWKYVLKISTYAKMLEIEGFKVRNLGITHVITDEDLNIVEQVLYKLPYKDFEVDLILKNRLKNLHLS